MNLFFEIIPSHLDDSWSRNDCLVLTSILVSLFLSAMTIVIAICIPRRIAKQQNKIAIFKELLEIYNLYKDISLILKDCIGGYCIHVSFHQTWLKVFFKEKLSDDQNNELGYSYQLGEENKYAFSIFDTFQKNEFSRMLKNHEFIISKLSFLMYLSKKNKELNDSFSETYLKLLRYETDIAEFYQEHNYSIRIDLQTRKDEMPEIGEIPGIFIIHPPKNPGKMVEMNKTLDLLISEIEENLTLFKK